MTRNFFILFIFLLSFSSVSGQYFPGMSQYMFAGMSINPAYAGSREALSLSVLYQNQWVGIEGAPTMRLMSGHTPLNHTNVSLGFMAYNESVDVHNNTGLFFNYAYRFRVGKGKLALGLKGGIDVYSVRWDQIRTVEKNDKAFGNVSSSYLYPNFGLGAYYDDDRMYVGFSVPFFFTYNEKAGTNQSTFQHDIANYPYIFTMGRTFYKEENFHIRPSVYIRYQNNKGMQVDINSVFVINDLLKVGAGYRFSDELVGMVDCQLNQQLRIGYAYDYAMGQLSDYNSGSHEIILQYDFSYFIDAKDPHY